MSDYTRSLKPLNTLLWLGPLAIGAGGVALLQPWDGMINRALTSLHLRGDFARELNALQQYGQGTAIVLLCLVVVLLDRRQRHRLLDYGVALAFVGAACTLMKWFVGRPRPKFDDPNLILGPFGMYPLPRGDGVVLAHAWELWKPISSDLWSMPSSHTAFAAAMSVMLATLYPRLTWLAVAMAALVGFGRMVFDAHWATDVLAGAVVGTVLSYIAMNRSLGVRLVRRLGGFDRPGDAQPTETAPAAIGRASDNATGNAKGNATASAEVRG